MPAFSKNKPILKLNPCSGPIKPIFPAKSDKHASNEEDGCNASAASSKLATNIFGNVQSMDTAANERKTEEHLTTQTKERGGE